MKNNLFKNIFLVVWAIGTLTFWYFRKDRTCSDFLIWDCNIDRHLIIPLIWSLLTGGLGWLFLKYKNILARITISLGLIFMFSQFLAFRGGVANNTACTEFNDTNTKNVCYILEARSSLDYSYCDKITDSRAQQYCYSNVYYWDKTIDFCLKDEQKNVCLDIISLRDNNKSICNQIDNPEIRKMCKDRKDW